MTIPTFTYDDDLGGYVCEPFAIDGKALVHIELASAAPVVTLKMEKDGGYANYGQTPKESDSYEINIKSNEEITVKLATPVEVKKCYIIN